MKATSSRLEPTKEPLCSWMAPGRRNIDSWSEYPPSFQTISLAVTGQAWGGLLLDLNYEDPFLGLSQCSPLVVPRSKCSCILPYVIDMLQIATGSVGLGDRLSSPLAWVTTFSSTFKIVFVSQGYRVMWLELRYSHLAETHCVRDIDKFRSNLKMLMGTILTLMWPRQK